MALIYKRLLILTTCICAWLSVVKSFKSGFSKESCDNMVPIMDQSPTSSGTPVSNSGLLSTTVTSAYSTTKAPVETTATNSEAPTDDSATQTPTVLPTEEPQSKPEDQTDKPEDQTETEAPTDKGDDQTEAPTDKSDEQTEAPTDKGDDQTEAPTDKADDQTEAPTDKADDQTESPTDKGDDQTEAPTDKADDQTEAPTDKADDQTEAPEDNGETQTETPEDNGDAQPNEPAEDVPEATEEQPSNNDEGESTSDMQPEDGDTAKDTSEAPAEDGGEATTASEAGDGDESSPETAELYKAALVSSEEASPFKIKLSSTIYRRNRPIQITLTGERFQAVMLQVRKDSARFGSFTEVSETLQTVECDAQKPSAVTNKDMNNKVNVTVTWTAPEVDQGPLTATATFVREEKYWGMVRSEEMVFSEFPTNLDDCAKSKSCVRLGSANCNEDSCRYVVTYQLTNDNSSVEFVIGGDVKVNGYIGLAFVENSQLRTTMDTTACLRTSETTADIKHYTFGPEGTLKTSNVEPVNLKWELVDKERLWCKFSLPVKESKKDGMKFTRPLYQVYLQGEFQVGNKSEEMIAPMNGGYVLSKNAVSISDLVDQRLPNGSTLPTNAAYVIISTLLFYSIT